MTTQLKAAAVLLLGRWYAGLTGTRKTFMNDFHPAELAFRLGPPGQTPRSEAP